MRAMHGSASTAGSARRLLPSLLAALGFVPLGLLLWWALAGPRPEPAPLDWSTLGFEVLGEDGAPPAFPLVHDLAWVQSRMVGWQADLGGQLGTPVPVDDGRYAAVVRDGDDGAALTPLAELTGVVEWSADADEATRCAFPEPVALDRLEDALDGIDAEVELELVAVTGRCTEDGPVVAVPVVRRHVVPLSLLERIGGQPPEEALVPQGAVLVQPDGTVTSAQELDGELALPAYPWEVARGALVEAAPENPAAEVGGWADPVYPILAPADDRLWWVMPLAPLDGAGRLSGYLLTAADELEGGTVNPVVRYWLDEPQAGPAQVIDWTDEVLDRLGDGEDDPVVRPTLPSDEGDWHGRVSTAEASVRYVVEASAGGEVCLADPDGSTISCRQDADVSRR